MSFEYHHQYWGELIYGAKDDIQAMGIAVDKPFPGQPGGPARRLTVSDPRGFRCEIERADWRCVGWFSCSISFPDRSSPLPVWEEIAPGVERCTEFPGDYYRGSGEALVAAGIIPAGYLPGVPGGPKLQGAFLPDGTRVPRSMHGSDLPPGAVKVARRGRRIEVIVMVEREVEEFRREASDRRHDTFVAQMNALPRPAPLVHVGNDRAARARRAKMRLVWSDGERLGAAHG